MGKSAVDDDVVGTINLGAPDTEGRSETMSNDRTVRGITQIEFAKPVEERLAGHRTVGSTRRPETKDERARMSPLAQATQNLERLDGERHLVLTTGLHPLLRERPYGIVEVDLRPAGFRRLREAGARQHDEEEKILDNLAR